MFGYGKEREDPGENAGTRENKKTGEHPLPFQLVWIVQFLVSRVSKFPILATVSFGRMINDPLSR